MSYELISRESGNDCNAEIVKDNQTFFYVQENTDPALINVVLFDLEVFEQHGVHSAQLIQELMNAKNEALEFKFVAHSQNLDYI